jgi:hypothetical protein
MRLCYNSKTGGVAAAFRLHNILKSHIREAQAKACGYQNMYYDTVSIKGGEKQRQLVPSLIVGEG